MHICITATVPVAIRTFMASHIQKLICKHQITVFAHGEPSLISDLLKQEQVKYIDTPIQRKISLFQDLAALFFLWKQYRELRPNVVFSVMPKAGLLAMLAAKLARTPVRMHIFTGQVWANKRGVVRKILKTADRCIALCATHILTDSTSQRDFLIAEGIVTANRITVLAKGSICGVNPMVFRPDTTARAELRSELSIPNDAVTFLYLGRLNRDKGIPELARAFARLAALRSDVYLVLVGLDEENLTPEIQTTCAQVMDRVRLPGFTSCPEKHMAMADVFCLASHREGFGSVIIEAAACKVPTIASRIYGITDAVVEDSTGLLFPAGDEGAMFNAMQTLATDVDLRAKLGANAYARALEDFSAEKVTKAMATYIEQAAEKSNTKNSAKAIAHR